MRESQSCREVLQTIEILSEEFVSSESVEVLREDLGEKQTREVGSLGCGAMETLLKVVVKPRPRSEGKKKKKDARELTSSSSSRYPSMPSYPPSPSRSEVDVSEIRKASFKVCVIDAISCYKSFLAELLPWFRGSHSAKREGKLKTTVTTRIEWKSCEFVDTGHRNGVRSVRWLH